MLVRFCCNRKFELALVRREDPKNTFWNAQALVHWYGATLQYNVYWYLPPIQYDLLAIYDQSNGLATALHGQCGLDKIIALAGTMYFCGILGLWLWLYILSWSSLESTYKILNRGYFLLAKK